MAYEFFIFEIKYRLRRPETYFFFLFLLLFAIVGVEFVFQGTDLGLVKKNSPLVIAKSMGALTGLSMIIVSMIMGVPILRDVTYDISSLLYVNPVSKKNYLLGRFLGSFVVLLFIFSGILWGMALAEFMPWSDPSDFLPFQFIHYLQPFLWIVLPILFFGASLFFVTGALSKSLMVVYTQGVFIFVLFIISKAISNEIFQAILDPFSLSALSEASKDWSAASRNSFLIPMSGIILFNKLFWTALGLAILYIGYMRFNLTVLSEKVTKSKNQNTPGTMHQFNGVLPLVAPAFHFKSTVTQLFLNTWFHTVSILRLTSFWAIVLCSFIVILVNSISLGTSYGVDSYPTTYLIIEELREISLFFFMILLTFYSGEIMWKERDSRFDSIYDALPLNRFLNLFSRFLALLVIYSIIILSLIASGILFQVVNGYYHFEIEVYCFGFFLELFPFLALYTLAAMFFQALSSNKFMGMIITIGFAIINVAIGMLGLEHALLNFGGQTLPAYSDMNGYGHFLIPYFWVKVYWILLGMLLLVFASMLMPSGNEKGLRNRWIKGKNEIKGSLSIFSLGCLTLFIGIGTYIFYNTNVLNEFWTKNEQAVFRADYEKALKTFEYIPQPKIIDIHLQVDLFPSQQAYAITGQYLLTNASEYPIHEIHLQKQILANLELKDVIFDRSVTANTLYKKYHYTIYELDRSLKPGDTLTMSFKQTLQPLGFEVDHSAIDVVNNGTFFDNAVLPGFGYQKKYELHDEDDRKDFDLPPPTGKLTRNDIHELLNARTGSDSDGITLEMIISTESSQTALSSGDLVAQWTRDDRNYFHYKTTKPIINFYPIVSANYSVRKDTCKPSGNSSDEIVDLEIYYQEGHEYNLNRMLESMKWSLDYYSSHFSPYPYKQLRIVEFPRYRTFAQSLPGIIPFSEAIGFVMDIDDAKDVDMVFFITAHEVAHQWWGIQLEAANVQGQKMILETLAQYAGLMVLKEKYGNEKVQQFLKLQLDAYQEGKLKSSKDELPLALVENEEYIYYNKGAIAMYELQKQIGEDKVNMALRNFLMNWKSFDNPAKPLRYTTTLDLLKYFREVSPDSSQHVITRLFENVYEVK